MSRYPDFAKVDWKVEGCDVLSVIDNEKETVVTIRSRKTGATGHMHLPHHTDEEMDAIVENMFDTAQRIVDKRAAKKSHSA